MPGAAGPFLWPYPLPGEANSLPAQVQALADAIDNSIVAVQAIVTATASRLRASAISNVAQSIATGVATAITYATEEFDTDGIINLGVSTTNFTINTAGLYAASSYVNFASNATGVREVAFVVNGTTVGALRTTPDQTGASTWLNPCQLLWLTPGDILTAVVAQNSGGALNVTDRRLSIVRMSHV